MKKYPIIPLSEITDEARKIAVAWGDEYFPGIALTEKHKLASDIMNYSREREIKAWNEAIELAAKITIVAKMQDDIKSLVLKLKK